MSHLTQHIRTLPSTPGVYFFYDQSNRLLYIGKSVNLRARVASYFRADGGHTRRTARLKDEAARIEVQACASELEALLVESQLIKHRQPLYNVNGRTYKHFPFIKIPDEPFARVHLTYELQDDGGRYFGPFPSEFRAREALDAMRPLFRWRSCQPLPRRPCFEHAIGRCSAPCVGLIDQAAYDQDLEELVGFLTGASGKHLARLDDAMREASEALMFERAAILRDRLAMLRPIVQRQHALQAAIAELDCLIVLPATEPGEFLWLVVRRGRLVGSERGVTLRRKAAALRGLRTTLAAPAPSLSVQQWELDEINIIAGWLHKHRERENAIALANRPLEEAIEEALACMRAAPDTRKAVAERVKEKVVAGPANASARERRGGPAASAGRGPKR